MKSRKIVVCFDKAMNRISQRGQMDIVIRFWNDETNADSSRYFGSSFLGQASAQCLFTSFKEALTEVPLTMLMQISMDGPAVNWKFLDLLVDSLQEDHDGAHLIEMGSCSLHIIHGTFQTGHKASGWSVNAYLRAAYGLFKDSPARRARFIEESGSTVFPQKFCQVRWIENVSAAERLLKVLANIKKYMENTKKLPSTFTCTTVEQLCADKLASAKIAFFSSVGSLCEPFLAKYQTPKPMAPFLYDDIAHLLRVVLKRFVKKSVMEQADTVSKLVKIDISKGENKCNYKEVDIGVGATKALAEAKASDSERLSFRMDCLKFLSAVAGKIVERSPMKYRMVRAISCLVPSNIISSPTLADGRMKDLVQILYDKGNITAIEADRCKSQFTDLCAKSSASLSKQFTEFNRSNDRLDTFYHTIIGQDPDFIDLFSVVKLVLTLSHGNASVESGFSVNGEMLVENLHEESLTAQRTVYDAVQSSGGLMSVNISRDMLMYVRGSNARYTEALERKRKASSDQDKLLAKKRAAATEIKKLEVKKAKLLQEATAETHKMEFKIAELKKLQKM